MKENKRNKKIILKPLLKKSNLSKESTISFINKVRDKVDLLYIDPSENINYDQSDIAAIKTIFPSENADYIVFNSSEEIENFIYKHSNNTYTKNPNSGSKGEYAKKRVGMYKKVNSNKDIQEIKTISEKGS